MADEADGASTITLEEEVAPLPEGIDDPMILKAELAKKDKAIRQIHARAIKAETLLKERGTPKNDEPIINSPSPASIADRDYVELRMQGYTADDVTEIAQYGGLAALKDPNSILSQGLKAKQEQRLAEEAANGVSSTVGLSEIERKYTPEQLRNMSVKELEAILPHNN